MMNAVAELLRAKGVPNVLFWSEDPSGLVAAHFASIFFGTLALEGSVSLLEAYALALFSTQVRSARSCHMYILCYAQYTSVLVE